MAEVLHVLLQELCCAMGDDTVTLLSAQQSLDLLSNFLAANVALFMRCYTFLFPFLMQAKVHLSESQATFLCTTFSQARDIKVDMPNPRTHEWEDAYLTL